MEDCCSSGAGGIVAAICGAGTYAITQFKRKTIFISGKKGLNDE
jgi:hypothetical protein